MDIFHIYLGASKKLYYRSWKILKAIWIPLLILLVYNYFGLKHQFIDPAIEVLTPSSNSMQFFIKPIVVACTFAIDLVLISIISIHLHRVISDHFESTKKQGFVKILFPYLNYIINVCALIALAFFLPYFFYLLVKIGYNYFNPSPSEFNLNVIIGIYVFIGLLAGFLTIRLLVILPASSYNSDASLGSIWTLTRKKFFSMLGIISLPLLILFFTLKFINYDLYNITFTFKLIFAFLVYFFWISVVTEVHQKLVLLNQTK